MSDGSGTSYTAIDAKLGGFYYPPGTNGYYFPIAYLNDNYENGTPHGGTHVNMDNNGNGVMRFFNVNVPTAGDYLVTFLYAQGTSPDDGGRAMNLEIDCQNVAVLDFPGPAGYTYVAESQRVHLAAGTHEMGVTEFGRTGQAKIIGTHQEGNETYTEYGAPRFATMDVQAAPSGHQLKVQGATASTEQAPDHAAAKAIDDNVSTYWVQTSGSGSSQWLKLDLGSPQSIRSTRIAFFDPTGRTYTYDILVSNSSDDATFTRVASNLSSSNGTYTQASFAATSAQYVKINVTNVVPGGLNVKIDEAQVWGP